MRRCDPRGQRNRRNLVEQAGNLQARDLKVGDLVAVQAPDPTDPDGFWVGVCVDGGHGTPTIQHYKSQGILNGVNFKAGEYAIAVKWLERDVADPDRLTFAKSAEAYSSENPRDIFNSCSLRSSKFTLEPVKRMNMALRHRENKDIWLENHLLHVDDFKVIQRACI